MAAPIVRGVRTGVIYSEADVISPLDAIETSPCRRDRTCEKQLALSPAVTRARPAVASDGKVE